MTWSDGLYWRDRNIPEPSLDPDPLPPDDETDTGRRVYWDSFGMHCVDEESEDEE